MGEKIKKFENTVKNVIPRQIRKIQNQTLYRRKPHQRIIRKNLYYLIKDLNDSMNLKILQSMIEEPSFQCSEDDLYVLLEELTFIQGPGEYTQDDLMKFATRIKIITSVLEYIILNVETIRIEPSFYETISNQLKEYASCYENHFTITSWATSLNNYIPREETIHKYHLEFSLEYLFDLLKILQKNDLRFQKVNLHVDHFLKVLVRSIGYSERIGSRIPSSLLPLEQYWEKLLNVCDFGSSVSPFFTNYYLLKKIKMIIQAWSCEGDKIMISKYGKRLLLEFMWMHADKIWFEEMKYDRKMNSSNDEILTQDQLKSIVFLFGILDLMENYIIESEHLSILSLVYYFARESLQKTTSAPIQIKSTVILLKLYFRDGNFFKIIEQDFEGYFQDLDKKDTGTMTHFKAFLLAIKPSFCQQVMINDNDTLFENFRGTILLSKAQNKGNSSSMNKNMMNLIADEMTCSVTLEPGENLCILGCEHIISYEAFFDLLKMSKYRCPQCRQTIQDNECIFLPQHHIYSYFYVHFVTSGMVSTPPNLTGKSHYFPVPLLKFDPMTPTPQSDFNLEDVQLKGLPNRKPNLHADRSRIWWRLKTPKKLHPAYNEALNSLNNKRYEESVLWLTHLLQCYPNSYSVRCDRAFINSLLLNQHFRALEDLKIALSSRVRGPHAWCLRGEIFRRIGHYDDALFDLNRALQLSPNNSISYGVRGALFYKMKRFDEALKDLNHSLQKLPNNEYCLGFRGVTLMKVGSNNDALEDFNKALEINPDDVFVLVKRAKLYHTLCLDDSALNDINSALSIRPCNYKALLIRGEIYAAMSRDSEALSDAIKSLEMRPNNINGLRILAKLYHKMNRNEEALDSIDKALNLKPNDVSILELRGEIDRSMCCFEKAIDDFNQILQLDSNNIFALSYRGATKYDQGLYEEALDDMNRALELRQENNSFILKTRAKIFIALERYHEALLDQNEILDNDPNNRAILLERREVYHKLGLYDKSHSNSTHRNRITLKSTYSC